MDFAWTHSQTLCQSPEQHLCRLPVSAWIHPHFRLFINPDICIWKTLLDWKFISPSECGSPSHNSDFQSLAWWYEKPAHNQYHVRDIGQTETKKLKVLGGGFAFPPHLLFLFASFPDGQQPLVFVFVFLIVFAFFLVFVFVFVFAFVFLCLCLSRLSTSSPSSENNHLYLSLSLSLSSYLSHLSTTSPSSVCQLSRWLTTTEDVSVRPR